MSNESSIEMLDRIIALHNIHVKILESEVERLKGEKLNQSREMRTERNSIVSSLQSDILRLQSDLARCKAERLELINALDNLCKSNPLGSSWDYAAAFDKARQLIVAYRASQQTQEGKG